MSAIRVTVTVLFLGLAQRALPCSCVDYLQGEPVEALEHSGLVFSGKAVRVEVLVLPIVSYSSDQSGGELIPFQHMARKALVTFRVAKIWKGAPTKEIKLLAGAPPEAPLKPGEVLVDCQFHFEVGHDYLVFASDQYPEANPCAPTRELSDTMPEIPILNSYVADKAVRTVKAQPE